MSEKVRNGQTAGFHAEELFANMAKLPRHPDEPPILQDCEPVKLKELEQLERDVVEGLLDPNEADQYLTKRFSPAFTRPPREPDIWSTSAPAWNVEMVASWIIWTDRALTLRHHEGSYEGARIWVSRAVLLPFMKPALPGFALHKFKRATVLESFIGYDGRRYSFSPFHAWQPGLIAHLITSKITCSALQADGDGNRVIVSAADWEKCELDSVAGETVLRVAGELKYSGLLFLASEVLAAYPAGQTRNGLRRWKVNPPVKKLSKLQFQMYEIIRNEFKNGVPVGDAAARNRRLEERAYKDLKARWEKHDTFARFVNKVLEITCEKTQGGRGRPRKS